MSKFASYIPVPPLLASLVLFLANGAVLADEPVDPADDTSPAITDAAEAAKAQDSAPPAGPDGTPPEAPGAGNAADTGPEPAAAPEPAGAAPEAAVADDLAAPAGPADPAVAVAIDTLDADGHSPPQQSGPQENDQLAAGQAEAEPGDAPDPDAQPGQALEAAADEPPAPGPTAPADETPAVPLRSAVTVADEATARTLTMLNAEVLPGTYQRLSWSATEMFEDLPVSTPVLVVNGRSPGPTLCLTAALHGDELNGIEMVRRVMHDLNPKTLSGAVVGVPIVNLQGFRRGSRYLPDRRDLNRYFPGNPRGSAASRIAHSFFTEVIEHCDALVDLHTGSFDRANLPQLRADLRNPDVVTLTHGFGATVILHSAPADGTLRYAATAAGIPTVTLEAGGPSELELKEVMHGVKGIETLLNTLGMVDKVRLWGDQQPVYYRSSWVRANRGGILLADVSLGSTVRRGDLLGTITDPMNNASTNLYSPYSGRVIGMARNQVVMPGFAAFHVGIQAIDASAVEAGRDAERAEERKRDETLARGESEVGDYVDGMSE